MLRCDERGKHNMSRGHGNHSAEEKVAAVAGEVGQGSKLDRARRGHRLQRGLHGSCQPTHKRRGRCVPRADGSRKAQPLQAHVAQGVAGGVQKRGQRVRFIYVQLRLLPGQVLLFAQHAPMCAPKGVAPLKGGCACAEGCVRTNAHLPGKFQRNAAKVKRQERDGGEVDGQFYTFSIIIKTFFPN